MLKYFLSIFLILATILPLSAQKQKVIFDCDLGGDIDDAFALALLLTSQDELEILGFCMDHGNTPGRGQLACKMLYECGLENIPVFIGRHTATVVGEQTEPEGRSRQMLWAEGFETIKPQAKPAADFILETLNKYPGEVILFTVGPVDNIADVLDKDPGALKKAKQVVAMFGSIKTGYGGGEPSAEWNVRGSIAAGKKLMNSGANLLLAPLDCTDHVIYPENFLLALSMRNTPLTHALGSLYSLWFRHAEWATRPKMFDGVAVGMVLWPELFETQKAFVFVDDKGFTRVDETKPANCSYGETINDQDFLKRLHEKLMMQNFKRN